MWSKLHKEKKKKKISVTVCMPVQFHDWWGKYLREGQGMRGVLVLSVWDWRVVIKEVAHLGLSWGCTANTPPNPLWASQGPSIPLHRITVATALPRLPINPLASRSFPISMPAPQPVSSCPTTPGLTIAYPAGFKSVNPGPVKLLSA